MANSIQRLLLKLDAEILDLERLYESELQRERDLDKYTLLLSRGIRYRLEDLRKKRARIIKNTGIKFNRIESFQFELQLRIQALNDAEKELVELNEKVKNLAVVMIMNPTEEVKEDYKITLRAIRAQHTVVMNKNRAVNNWRRKEDYVPRPKSREHDFTIKMATNVQTKTQPELLPKEDPWDIKPVNNASFDLLARPEENTNTGE